MNTPSRYSQPPSQPHFVNRSDSDLTEKGQMIVALAPAEIHLLLNLCHAAGSFTTPAPAELPNFSPAPRHCTPEVHTPRRAPSRSSAHGTTTSTSKTRTLGLRTGQRNSGGHLAKQSAVGAPPGPTIVWESASPLRRARRRRIGARCARPRQSVRYTASRQRWADLGWVAVRGVKVATGGTTSFHSEST
jgi:hypothetical protein